MAGNGALKSGDRMIGNLADLLPPVPEESTAHRGEGQAGVKLPVVKGSVRTGVEHRTTWTGGRPGFLTVEAALRAFLENRVNGDDGLAAPRPLLLSVDEAHAADPATLGEVLNAVLNLSGEDVGLPVGIALADTPDVLDVLDHPDCKATWFLDRAAANKRLVPMPNDLARRGLRQGRQGHTLRRWSQGQGRLPTGVGG